jgi:hypothetical protein
MMIDVIIVGRLRYAGGGGGSITLGDDVSVGDDGNEAAGNGKNGTAITGACGITVVDDDSSGAVGVDADDGDIGGDAVDTEEVAVDGGRALVSA